MAETKQQSNISSKARRFIARTKASLFLNAVHKWQLYDGKAPVGEPQEMFGYEVVSRNKKLEDEFWKALDSTKTVHLKKWRLIQREIT